MCLNVTVGITWNYETILLIKSHRSCGVPEIYATFYNVMASRSYFLCLCLLTALTLTSVVIVGVRAAPFSQEDHTNSSTYSTIQPEEGSNDTHMTFQTIDCDGFQCMNGRCIKNESVCDLELDCGDDDDSDETNCSTFPCATGEFHCGKDNLCVDEKRLCDGTFDCFNKEDEDHENCNGTVTEIQKTTKINEDDVTTLMDVSEIYKTTKINKDAVTTSVDVSDMHKITQIIEDDVTTSIDVSEIYKTIKIKEDDVTTMDVSEIKKSTQVNEDDVTTKSSIDYWKDMTLFTTTGLIIFAVIMVCCIVGVVMTLSYAKKHLRKMRSQREGDDKEKLISNSPASAFDNLNGNGAREEGAPGPFVFSPSV